jgi:hypothetical protein
MAFLIKCSGKKEGIIKRVDNQILIAIIYGFIQELSVQMKKSNTTPSSKILEESFSVCWDAISISTEPPEGRAAG